MYLLFTEENSVAGEDDAEGDATGGGTKSSMSGEGRARSSWRRIRRDVAPPDLDER